MTPTLHFKQFGRYEIIRKLGRSMTDVYLALDPGTNRRVVLKIVEHSHDAYTQLVMEAEKRGAAIQKQLHSLDPRILEIYDYGEENGCFFVVMEYVEGKSLAEILQAEKRLDPKRAARIAIEVCSQLQTLHSFETDIDGRKRAVVHGDIKPPNIQISAAGRSAASGLRHCQGHHLHAQSDPPQPGQPGILFAGACQELAGGSERGSVGARRESLRNGGRHATVPGPEHPELENLIQSRRPPRALPETCPPSLKAVISKLWQRISSTVMCRRERLSTICSASSRIVRRSPKPKNCAPGIPMRPSTKRHRQSLRRAFPKRKWPRRWPSSTASCGQALPG